MGKSDQTKGPAQGQKKSRGAAPPTVSARWMLGAVLVVIAAAALCAYATLGLLFYQGQWQFVLHPVKTITTTPHATFNEIRFDVTDTGITQLDGWWIPADPGSRWSSDVILYLHDGAGSLSNCAGDLDTMHALGINVFAFDYRGYGKSVGPHPTESRMSADVDAAWRYLTETRNLGSANIVVYGAGVGATLAADLATRHAVAGLVLDGPNEAAWKIIRSDGRAKILPMWLLPNEHFDPAGTLSVLTTPKLFVDRDGARPRTEQLYREAAAPKQYFQLKNDADYAGMMQRFLDQVLRYTNS